MISGPGPGKKITEPGAFHSIPDEAKNQYRQASELLHQGKTEDALDCLRHAVEIAPDYTEALHETGNCLQDLGRREEASRYYARALQKIGDRLCEIGRYEEAMGRYWVAIRRYEEAGSYYQPSFRPDSFPGDAALPQKKRDDTRARPDEGERQ
ncbi:MAG: Tetratricopeptide repeat protein [Methanoregula sp. PtaU1.Bin006]|uniref:tetratricopeptide repeat protein n=1 Tax=Methanoregula sp. PtaU1.Bin006 TaxID=1811681 RepID=UPI0009D0842F|nr:tetratricopeptide repeat protein [Methanoregula sp. PtaU1.Bin006]OPY32765.1 MAG: Tetratricopeptide repeat protein [Methanoregula sp. PtaU1.Bin006]